MPGMHRRGVVGYEKEDDMTIVQILCDGVVAGSVSS